MSKPTKRNYHAVVFTTWQAHALSVAAARGAEELVKDGTWQGAAGQSHRRACVNGLGEIEKSLGQDGVVFE